MSDSSGLVIGPPGAGRRGTGSEGYNQLASPWEGWFTKISAGEEAIQVEEVRMDADAAAPEMITRAASVTTAVVGNSARRGFADRTPARIVVEQAHAAIALNKVGVFQALIEDLRP